MGSGTDSLAPTRVAAQGFAAFRRENTTMMMRWFRRLRREPLSLITTLLQPVLWLTLFGHLFAEMARGPEFPGVSYLTFMTAGAIVMTVYNAGINGGLEILFDRETGFLERMMAAPIRRISLVISRFLYVLSITATQSLVIILMAYILGVRFASGLGGIAMILLVGMLLGIGLATVSVSLAFTVRHHGVFFTLIGFFSLPLIFLSTALAPLEVMPPWMRVLAQLNPLTYAINATRSLVIEGWNPGLVMTMIGILLLFNVIALLVGVRTLRRGLA